MNKYLWVVLPVTYLNAVGSGLYYSFGMYYAIWVDDFESSYAFIGLVATAASLFTAIFTLANPWMKQNFGYARCVFFGGLVSSLAFFSTSYDTNQYETVVTYSFLFGLSGAFGYLAYGYMFDNVSKEELNTAMAGIEVATAIFTVLFSCFIEYMLTHGSNWRNVFRYYFSLVGLSCCLCSVLLFWEADRHDYVAIREDEDYVDMTDCKTSSNDKEAEEAPPDIEVKRMSDATTSLWLREENTGGWERLMSTTDGFSALSITFSNLLLYLPSYIPCKFSLIYVTDQRTETVFVDYMVPIVFGIATAAGGICYGILSIKFPRFTCFEWAKVGQLGCAGSCLLMVLTPTRYSFAIKISGIGLFVFFITILYSIVVPRLFEVVGKTHSTENFSVWVLLNGIAVTIGGYIGGLIYDLTNSFHAVFLFVGAMYMFAFVYDELMYISWLKFRHH